MTERVGIILVHGIGEQKRFAHLDAEIRGIIEGLKRRKSARLTVEILSGNAAAYNAEHDTWASGSQPSARITVFEPNRNVEINVHEVWWADVNESYSLAKQIRFWMWGLSVWNFPESKSRPDLRGFADAMLPPPAPDDAARQKASVRFRLFLAGLFFLVAAFSLGAAVFFAKRLFGLEAPDFVRVFVNYISAVKLYNQSTRQGSGLLPNSHGFLDTLDDPPRVSIRRRMIQAIVAVASQKYNRWYILGHSLGSVVSFNGIMENGQAFANYLSRETWDDLKSRGWAGPKTIDVLHFANIPPGPMSPSRPVWLADDELVYREEIFGKFRGLLTYGSPLGKFAELWPARVPINKVEPVFQTNTEWINVYDGRDPVSGPLNVFAPAVLAQHGITPRHCPPLKGFSYRASRVLLLSHIRYLMVRNEPDRQLSEVVADWLVTGQDFTPPPNGTGRWHGAEVYQRRLKVSWIWWLAAFLFLAILGTITFMGLWDLTAAMFHKSTGWSASFMKWLGWPQ
jgi:hypothetical protein